ncbi:1-aminocyclopropane-1-carboxylate oxidase 4-like protein [Carex littledalei]|uniref:1-aminocyclopropane-1-carboxylate oxidase 4-like protein n=1 Tax=Carex littledalei TaxID=544730 RepID=A0A833VR08_9POAL|nr:1-aminocyclopropane-1-carboxylate oxidase 4-like protein [Carex littledalei]
MTTTAFDGGFDRAAAVKQFDESRTGVKGLVDSGVTEIPTMFRHNPDPLPPAPIGSVSVPTIDLSLPRSVVVDTIRAASHEWGFFQVINHGIPASVIDKTLSAIQSFNELPPSDRSPYYSRSMTGGVSYSSNVDLYKSSAASWRDTIQVLTGPTRPDPERIPPVCRQEILAWDEHVTKVGRSLLKLMSEGLGVGPHRLEQLTIGDGKVMVCHYYPPCPEPDATMGVVTHTDPGALTVLVQDSTGGLQVKRTEQDGKCYWVDIDPVPGALVINVGDLLQIISNDEFKSVEHRAVVRSRDKSRVSIAVFLNPAKRGDSDFYGPLPELISDERPAHYRNFTMSEFMGTFFSKQLASKALTDHFKL